MREAFIVIQMFVIVGISVAAIWANRPQLPAPAGQESNLISVGILTELQDANSPLARFYLGTRIEDGVATVYFRGGVEPYLYASPGMQSVYLQPIVRSLQSTPGLIKIQWAIDGRIITDFDA